MLLTYQECLDRYGSDYQLKKEIRNGNLFRKEKGIYSTARNTSEIDIIMRKYPKAVCLYRIFCCHNQEESNSLPSSNSLRSSCREYQTDSSVFTVKI